MSNYNSTLQSNNIDLQAILNTINELPEANSGGSIELPTLTNEGSASDLLSGKQLIDGEGKVVTGNIPTKTASNLTASGATVTVPSGYYSTQATKSVATATQATPSITINASGLITATATQTAGYVAAGTKSATNQLAFQAAKTITPSTVSQVAVSSGYYTGGNITVAAVPTQTKTVTPNTTTQNITPDSGKFLSKVTINAIPSTYVQPSGTLNVTENGSHDVKNYANVNVTVAGGGASGGEKVDYSDNEDAMITGTLSTYFNDRVTTIGGYTFAFCLSLTAVSFPVCTSIGSAAFNFCTDLSSISFPVCTSIDGYAFYHCSSLTSASFPNCTSIGSYAFNYCTDLSSISFPNCTTLRNCAFGECSSLTTVSFSNCTTIGSRAFGYCTGLTSASFPNCTSIGSYAFNYCYRLSALYLLASSICNLSASNAFTKTPFTGYSSYFSGTPYIYVPTSLVDAYKTATNWTYFSKYISAYTVPQGGISGGSD